MIYLSPDGASVNSGKTSGLITQLQKEHKLLFGVLAIDWS